MNHFNVFPLLLQIPALDTANTGTVLAWVASIAVAGLGALAVFYIKSQAGHIEQINKLNSGFNVRIDRLNEEIRGVYERSSERAMEWKTTLEKAAEQMNESQPTIKADIKELTQKLELYREEIRKIIQ